VDIQVQMLELLKARAEGRGLKNIRTIQGEAWDPKLPEASCDLILLVDVYHEFSHPEEQMKALWRALKPEGRIALVEFREEDETVPIRPEHKMSKAQILKEWVPMGFELDRSFDELPWQHLMFGCCSLEQKRSNQKAKSPLRWLSRLDDGPMGLLR
jgi:ubiquinone/menaquinone biosynthesis C-methylase UbiE